MPQKKVSTNQDLTDSDCTISISLYWLFYIRLHFGQTHSLHCGLAVLHYIEMKNFWVDSEVGFLHDPFRFCLYVSRGFHQDLGWLSCLRSPTFRHLYIVTRVSQDFTASVVYSFVIFCVFGASFSLIECASCHRYLEPNGFSAPILLSLCTIDDLTPELSSLTHSSSEDWSVFEFVLIDSFHCYAAVGRDFKDQEDFIGSECRKLQCLELVPQRWPLARLSWPMIVNVFVAFHESELSFSRRCSWLKGTLPGTRTLAAGIKKKTAPLVLQLGPVQERSNIVFVIAKLVGSTKCILLD